MKPKGLVIHHLFPNFMVERLAGKPQGLIVYHTMQQSFHANGQYP